MIKLFAIDMDGTFLNTKGYFNESTKEALKNLNESGVKSVLCSGRVATSIEHFTKELGLDNPVIGNNGSIVKINHDHILYSHPLEDSHLKELIDFCDEHRCKYHFYDEDTFYSNRLNPEGVKHLMFESEYGMNLQCNLDISDRPYERLKERNKNAYKILVGNLREHPYVRERIIQMFEERFSDYLYITSSGPGSIEIMEKKVNKWNGILELADFLGINKDEIAAIGDSYNDLPMLQNARLSFAMGNANDEIKAAANYTVSNNDGPAMAEAVDRILEFNKENASV